MILVGSLPSYKSVLQGTLRSPRSPPLPIHPCYVRLLSDCISAFATFPYSLEPGFAGVTAFGKLPKDPVPLHSLRLQYHFGAGRTSTYLPPMIPIRSPAADAFCLSLITQHNS